MPEIGPQALPSVYITVHDSQIITSDTTVTAVDMVINISKPTGHVMFHKFNIQQLYVLPTQCIYVFCVDLRTNSDYFPIQH